MNIHTQRFITPDGIPMVILPAVDFERLIASSDGAVASVVGQAGLAARSSSTGAMPSAVLDFILSGETTAVGAWRQYRGLSQAHLALKAGLSQVFVSKIERGESHGTPKTRAALASALGAPLWALEEHNKTKRAQSELQSLIIGIVAARPGITESELAKAIKGKSGYQQQVNQDCRILVSNGLIERQGTGGKSDPYRYVEAD
jgi:transcriptional regulator with XRE-family HTH domain